MEHNVKTFRSLVSAEIWRVGVLIGETQCRTTPEQRNENISFPRLGIEPSLKLSLAPLRHDWSQLRNYILNCDVNLYRAFKYIYGMLFFIKCC